jgi:hypothetical protein
MMDLDRAGEPEPRVSYLQAADVLAGAHAFGAFHARQKSRTEATTSSIMAEVNSGYIGNDTISVQAFSAIGNCPTRPRKWPYASCR